jgi:hypothetical protein
LLGAVLLTNSNKMAKYRAKQINQIEAEQFLPPLQIPKGVFNVYGSPNGEVYSGQVWTIQGERVNVKSGEWIVQEPDNPERYYPIADEVFKRKYELVQS